MCQRKSIAPWEWLTPISRLVYNWVLLDLELSLFHDTAPLLAISDLQCPLPGPEALWSAPNWGQFKAEIQSLYGPTANVSPHLWSSRSLSPSLFNLFQDFLEDNDPGYESRLSPQQMRLLLHPLQRLLCHLQDFVSCFTDILSTRRTTSRALSKASTIKRFEEIHDLLKRWHEIALSMLRDNPSCPVLKCNLVLYHLISLNAVTNFPEIERLARREGFETTDGPTYWDLSLRHKRCISDPQEALLHCGRVFTLLRSLPADGQPSWWSTALYRVTLVMWANGIGRLDPSFKVEVKTTLPGKTEGGSPGSSSGGAHQKMGMDHVEDPCFLSRRWENGTWPYITRADGEQVNLDDPAEVLELGTRTIAEGVSTRMGDGTRRKLATLAENWTLDSISAMYNVIA